MLASRTSGLVLLSLLAFLLGAGCRGERARTIERETFVATYVDLRRAARESPAGRISPERRAQVLALHGVTEDDLLRFAEVHGGNVAYMAEVWGEVEERLGGGDASGVAPR